MENINTAVLSKITRKQIVNSGPVKIALESGFSVEIEAGDTGGYFVSVVHTDQAQPINAGCEYVVTLKAIRLLVDDYIKHYTPKAAAKNAARRLAWPDVWKHSLLKKDNGDRWQITEGTPKIVRVYLEHIRQPSRSYPQSYARALLTSKFANYVVNNDPSLASDLGLL